MTTPPLTVLMAVYNGEAHLREAINSILRQSYRDFELLVVDDASTDATPDILASYGDHRIRVLRNSENNGLTRSLNIGLREARGDLIARQDADDVSFRDRLARQAAFLERNGEVAAVGAQFVVNDERGRRRPPHLWMKCETSLGIRWQSMFENPFVHTSVVFRRAIVLEQLGGYDEAFRTSQDLDLWSRLGREYDLGNLHEALVAVRGRRASISQQYSDEAIRVASEVLMRNIVATIGAEPAARDGIEVVVRGTNPRLYEPLETLDPLTSFIDSAYSRFVANWPEAAHLREIRAHSASLVARIATIAANASPAKMVRWYLKAAGYDVPTFARGALRFGATSVRSLAGRAPRFPREDEIRLEQEPK